ncbi:unnamed protein product [Discosporangium mesarthrocarpum]
MVKEEGDKSIPVYILGHSMGSLVATVATSELEKSPGVGLHLKKLILSGCPLVVGPGAGSPLGLKWLHPFTRNPKRTMRLTKAMAWMDPNGPASPLDLGLLPA